MVYKEYNEDYGRSEFGTAVDSEFGKYNALQSLLIGKQLGDEEVQTLREFGCVQKFLDSPMGDKSEVKLKKAFSTAVVIANEVGGLPFKVEKSPVAIASTVDEGLSRIKTAYKVAQGEMDVTDVVDHHIDAVAARVKTVADKVIEVGAPIVVDKVCKVVNKVFPPAKAVVPLIKKAERFIRPKVKAVVRKGISVVANAAKVVVRSVVNVAKKVAGKIMNWLFG